MLASKLGAAHPNRWLASGVAISFQALGIDYVGLVRSQAYHRSYVLGLEPSLAIAPTAAGTETRLGLSGRF